MPAAPVKQRKRLVTGKPNSCFLLIKAGCSAMPFIAFIRI